MPMKMAKFLQKVSLMQNDIPTGSGLPENFTKWIILVVILVTFLFDVFIVGYYYLFLHSSQLPGFVFLTGGSIIGWAFNGSGIQSAKTIQQAQPQPTVVVPPVIAPTSAQPQPTVVVPPVIAPTSAQPQPIILATDTVKTSTPPPANWKSDLTKGQS